MSALALDPLIAEAKQRARRRRLLALGGIVVVAAAATATLAPRSSANSRGICATPPSGFKQRTATWPRGAPPTVVLTNFRFGRMNEFYGLDTTVPHPMHWPAGGVMVAVTNFGPAKSSRLKAGPLRVERGSFGGMEGAKLPAAEFQIQLNGRFVGAKVEVGTLTPATIAAANDALAGVRVCSA